MNPQSVPFYESMTQFINAITGKKIRVWRREDVRPRFLDVEVFDLLTRFPNGTSNEVIIDELVKLGRIAAIEITDMSGNGFVEYLEW